MKTLTKLTLAAVILTSAFAGKAEMVRGHFRSNGTYVAPYYRTPANGTPYDNLSYRGYPSQQPGYVSPRSYGFDSGLTRPTPLPSYGNFKLETMPRPSTGNYPSQQPGYAPDTYSATAYPSCSSSSYSIYGNSIQIDGTTFHNYHSSDGGSLSGTTLTIGNTSFTTLNGW